MDSRDKRTNRLDGRIRKADGWMDGVDGLDGGTERMDRQTGGINRLTDGRVDGWIDRLMKGWTHGRAAGSMDRWRD